MKIGIKLQIIETLAGIILTFSLANSVFSQSIDIGSPQLNKIEIIKPALYPESLKYNSNTDKFILGSFRDGGIYEVDEQGNYQRLINDKRLSSVLGVWVDSERNRLLVVSGDLGSSINTYPGGARKLAVLGIYKLNTGAPIHFVDLSKFRPDDNHLPNGITIDSTGNAYVTDSFSPVIYKINLMGEASVFLEREEFKGQGINLNGITFHPDGYLIVAHKSAGTLFKIPLNQPEQITKIKINQKLFGSDGVTLLNNQNILIVANRASGVNNDKAFVLKSNDNWKTANIMDEYEFANVYPTTSVVKNGKIYVLHSSLNLLVKAPPVEKRKMNKKAIIQQIGTIQP